MTTGRKGAIDRQELTLAARRHEIRYMFGDAVPLTQDWRTVLDAANALVEVGVGGSVGEALARKLLEERRLTQEVWGGLRDEAVRMLQERMRRPGWMEVQVYELYAAVHIFYDTLFNHSGGLLLAPDGAA